MALVGAELSHVGLVVARRRAQAHGAERGRRGNGVGRPVVAGYALAVGALVVYAVSVLLRGGAYSTDLDGWVVDGIDFLGAGLCLWAAYRYLDRRTGATCLGLALLSWACGDTSLTVESLGGATPPVPSVADAFYIGFYPLAFAAALLFIRQHLRDMPGPNWWDGLVAGLGAAAICAAAFRGIQHSAGTGVAGTITNLAYPVGDLILLAAAVGGLALVPRRGKKAWALLAVGMITVALGDVVNLFSNILKSSLPGTFVNSVAWPAGILVMSASCWVYRRRAQLDEPGRPPAFILPAAAALSALGIVLLSSVTSVNRAGLALAGATLFVVGVRGVGALWALRSISEERHQQAITDQLTGLRNRRFVVDLLDDYFASRERVPGEEKGLAFLFVDLDRFKEVNDSFGHPAGDELLAQLGARFLACVGARDVAARLGGDEFAVLLLDVNRDEAAVLGRRLLDALREPFSLRAVKAQIGASIGIALDLGAASPTELIWQADRAMYQAKQAGSGISFHSEGSRFSARIQVVEQLRTAIEQKQLLLHYQPLLDIARGQVAGAEALLRWHHPELGLVPPLEFLPVAEEAGLMRPITIMVLEEALGQVAAWRSAGRKLSVSVNISPGNLLEDGFVNFVQGVLRHHSLPPEALVLEVTETAVIREFARCRQVIETFDQLGIVVSIDDFGSGATSLTYLSELRGIRELKLDRSFITGISEKPRERELVRATIDLGHRMGLRVVAEGIEDLETLRLLADLGCDIAQGYYIGRPKPPQEFAFRQTVANLSAAYAEPVAGTSPTPPA